MIELHFKYDYDMFGGKPKRDIDKIEECKILFYGVSDNTVELIVQCTSQDIADKLKHYLIMVYEIIPKKTITR
jgi:hypothetical protein